MRSHYKVKTLDGVVVRESATRPYTGCWVSRDRYDRVVKRGCKDFTTRPKIRYGTIVPQTICGEIDYWRFEKLIPIVFD